MRNAIALALLAVCFAAGAPAGGSEIEYTLPGASQWQIEPAEQSRADLRDTDGVLQVNYDIRNLESFQAGHVSTLQGRVKLLLKQPIELDEQVKRVYFEARGVRESSRAATQVLLLPLLRDASGEQLAYVPRSQQHLRSGSPAWSGWMTHSFYSTEAGGATSASYLASGGDGNSWPDGKLTFLGFELVARNEKPTQVQGTIELAGFAFGGFTVPGQDPYLFADALLSKAGRYRVAAQVLNRFQGVPLRETVQAIEFDPQRPSLARQKIRFKLGPDDNYWIRYQVTGEEGEVIKTDQLRAWVEDSAGAEPPPRVDMTSPPSIGYLRLNPGHAGAGVFEKRDEVKILVRAFAKDLPRYRLSWRVERVAFPEKVAEGVEQVDFAGGASADVTIAPALPPVGDAFRLIVEVDSDGKKLDQQDYLFGIRTDLSREYANRQGERTTRNDVKKSAYVRITYLPSGDKKIAFPSRGAYIERFSRALREISKITPNVTIVMDLAELEVLPGVYDFDLLDRMMDAAFDHGCRLTLRLGHADLDGRNLLRWQRYWPQRNSDGTINPGHSFYGSFSLADREFVDNFLRAFKATDHRYRRHPAFQGYQVFEIAGEWAVLDQPWNGSIVGYERVARDAFVEYVRQRITDDLDALNRRWGTQFADWSAVVPPRPLLESGPKPDLRRHWLDFCEFKHYLDSRYWVSTAGHSIRAYDPDCVVIVYNLDPGGFEESGDIAAIDYLHNGGNHFLRGEGALIDAWIKHRIGWITEPHMPHRWAAYGDPGDRGWLLDWTTYIMLAQAGGGGANMHIYYWPLPGEQDLDLVAHYGREYAFDRFQRWRPLLEEMHGVRIASSPPQIAVLQDIYTLYSKHRTVFEPRMDDLRRWFELLKDDSLPYEDYRPANRAAYRVILPNILDEVMTLENIQLVRQLVDGGAITVVSAMTGSKCPQRPDESFVLLRELGIAAPAPDKPFSTTAEGVAGTVIAENPFLASGANVPFYTLADLKRELAASDMKARFHQWRYRWLPQTDYFRVYPGHRVSDGQIIATFADGGTAISLHPRGKGHVLVFWGMPDYSSQQLRGFMQKLADFAGVVNPRKDNPVPLTLEGDHERLKRHYAIMFQDQPGTYRQKLPRVPDGSFFIDDMVCGQRLGIYSADELRGGIEITWQRGFSPLKVLRMIPLKEMESRWADKYPRGG